MAKPLLRRKNCKIKSNERNHTLKSLVLTSFMSLVNSNAEAKDSKLPELGFNPDNEDEVSKVKNRLTTNVIKISPTGRVYEVNAHNSHSSHRSHSSHSSSSTGHYSSSWYSSKTPNTSTSKSKSIYTVPKKTASTYSLGERTIRLGTYGADVDVLVELLIKYHYLDRRDVIKKSGYSVYDTYTSYAIKHFQKDVGYRQSGKADTLTISALKTWNANETTVELGFREITLGDCGYDVSTLIELLNSAGYAIEPDEIEYCGKYAKFNDKVKIELMKFQEHNGLEPSGTTDFKTIKKLQKLKKKANDHHR